MNINRIWKWKLSVAVACFPPGRAKDLSGLSPWHRGKLVLLQNLRNSALEVTGGEHHVRPLYLPEETRYSSYSRVGELQGQSGPHGKSFPQPGFNLRTVQYLVICFTDYAIALTKCTLGIFPMTKWQRNQTDTCLRLFYSVRICGNIHPLAHKASWYNE